MSPMKMKDYPKNWRAISYRIRFERAQGKCEQCGAPHDHTIVRSFKDPALYLVKIGDRWHDTLNGITFDSLEAVPSEFKFTDPIRCLLTVHHIGVPKEDGSPGDPRDKMDCRDENLIALCQLCHLRADAPLHAESRARYMARKKAQRPPQLRRGK